MPSAGPHHATLAAADGAPGTAGSHGPFSVSAPDPGHDEAPAGSGGFLPDAGDQAL